MKTASKVSFSLVFNSALLHIRKMFKVFHVFRVFKPFCMDLHKVTATTIVVYPFILSI